jgi:hypothetical protein
MPLESAYFISFYHEENLQQFQAFFTNTVDFGSSTIPPLNQTKVSNLLLNGLSILRQRLPRDKEMGHSV